MAAAATGRYDVIVVGLGGHGSAIAAECAARGLRVLGLERFEKGDTTGGSSHGRSRIIRTAYFEGEVYVPLVQRAITLWQRLQDKHAAASPGAEPLLNLVGGLVLGKRDSDIIQGTLHAAAVHNLPHTVLTPEQVTARWPAFTPAPDEVAVFEEQAGYLCPELCIQANQAVAVAHGAVLKFGTQVTGWDAYTPTATATATGGKGKGASVFTVRTADGACYTAQSGVLSCGAWAGELYAEELNVKLQVMRQVLHWFQPADASLFVNTPIYIWEVEDEQNFYGFPVQGGGKASEGVKVAAHQVAPLTPRGNLRCTPSTIDRGVHAEEVAEIAARIAPRMPTLCAKHVESATCMYTMTEDEHFILDAHPAHANVQLVSPCSGHGFKFCSVVGEIVAELIADGRTQHDISLFSLRRFAKGKL